MNSSEARVAAVPSRRRLPCSVTLWSLAVRGRGCGVLPNAPTVQRFPSIGYLIPGPRDEYADRVEAFSGGLHDVVRQSVDVIVTGGLTLAGETAPAETGIVPNLAHPGGNVRGVSSCVPGWKEGSTWNSCATCCLT